MSAAVRRGLYALLLLVCMPLLAAANSTGFDVAVTATQPCALLRFVESAAGIAHRNEDLRKYYLQNHKQTAAEKALLERYRAFAESRYELFAPIANAALKSQTLLQFESQLKGILKPGELTVAMRAFRHFDPIHRQLIWRPAQPGLQAHLTEFRQGFKNTDFAGALMKVKTLFQSEWSPEHSFMVALVPVPDKLKSTSAESMDALQIVEVKNRSRFLDSIDAVFHEFCHALYRHAPKTLTEDLHDQFLKLDGGYVFNELNEAMCTALGQGWFYERVTKKSTDSNTWYTDKYISGFAAVLKPLLSEYLENGRSLDAEFASRAKQLFDSKFPDGYRDTNVVLSEFLILSSSRDIGSLRFALLERLPHCHGNYAYSGPLSSPKLKDRFLAQKAVTTIFLYNRAEIAELNKLPIESSVIERLRTGSGSQCLVHRQDGRWLIFCVAPTLPEQQKLLIELLKKPLLDT